MFIESIKISENLENMVNITDDTLGYSKNGFYVNSGNMFFSESITPGVSILFTVEVVVGATFLVHSFLLKGFKWDAVRICTDVSCVLLLIQGVLFLQCVSKDLYPVCTIKTQAIYNDIISNLFCNGIGLVCDLYITFLRYDKVVGGASILHKRLAFAWCVIFIYSWIPFSTILPIFFNMNSVYWVYIQFIICQWGLFSGYALYDCFYIVLVLHELQKVFGLETDVSNSDRFYTLREKKYFMFGVRSIMHTLTSLCGVLSIAYMPFLGIPIQNLLVSVGLHLFINWRDWSWKSCCPYFKLMTVDLESLKVAPSRVQAVLEGPDQHALAIDSEKDKRDEECGAHADTNFKDQEKANVNIESSSALVTMLSKQSEIVSVSVVQQHGCHDSVSREVDSNRKDAWISPNETRPASGVRMIAEEDVAKIA